MQTCASPEIEVGKEKKKSKLRLEKYPCYHPLTLKPREEIKDKTRYPLINSISDKIFDFQCQSERKININHISRL